MGLDLLALGRPQAGFENTWSEYMARCYAGEELSEEEQEVFVDRTIATYEEVNAPIVGRDAVADEWMLERKEAGFSDQEWLKETTGYAVVDLVRGQCDGVPKYSNFGVTNDEDTSFRGEFLNDCEDCLTNDILSMAYQRFMSPAEAIVYGNQLLNTAQELRVKHQETDFNFDQSADAGKELKPIQSKIDIIESAGKWYKFWGEKGNPINAWY